MKIVFFAVFFSLYFFSCSGVKEKSNRGVSVSEDTAHKGGINMDDLNNKKDISGDIDSLPFPDSTEYKSKVNIDSTFFSDNKKYTLVLWTDFDSSKSITIPQKYVGIYGLKKFTVFESYTRLKIFRGGQIWVDTTIRKSDFKSAVDSSLLKYGNLFFPTIAYNDSLIEISHSLSIPMTDIGVPVSTKFYLK